MRLRILVLSAHCDDETLGLGAHIAAWRRLGHSVKLVFLTDGTPRNRKYIAAGWTQGPREYRLTRRAEAQAAAMELGLDAGDLVFQRFRDQELAANLDSAWKPLKELSLGWRPDWTVAPAWQGGHPDHDAGNCLNAALREMIKRVAAAGRKRRFLEYSLYARAGKEIRYLPALAGEKNNAELLPEDWGRKYAALAHYQSQMETLKPFSRTMESLREMPQYDYSKPPEAGYAYALWGWNIEPLALSRQFHEFMARQAARP